MHVSFYTVSFLERDANTFQKQVRTLFPFLDGAGSPTLDVQQDTWIETVQYIHSMETGVLFIWTWHHVTKFTVAHTNIKTLVGHDPLLCRISIINWQIQEGGGGRYPCVGRGVWNIIPLWNRFSPLSARPHNSASASVHSFLEMDISLRKWLGEGAALQP